MAAEGQIISKNEQVIKQFMDELKLPESEWTKCGSNDFVTVWRKMDEERGLYRLKLVGRIPAKLDVIDKVLFDNALRKSWDKVIEEIVEVEKYEDGSSLIHISARAPPGIANRDFVHFRSYKEVLSKSNELSKIIIDVSTESDKVPLRESYVRAHTVYSGGLLEPTLIPNMKTKQLEAATLYSMISQVDLKGYIPKTIVNLASSKSTMDWFTSLCQACQDYLAGNLHPVQ